MSTYRLLLAAVAASAPAAAHASTYQLGFLDAIDSSGGAEIVSYDRATSQLFVTTGNGINVFGVSSTGLSSGSSFSFMPGFTIDSVSSVAMDPLGRGFGVAAIVPDDNTGTPGLVAFFNSHTNALLGSYDVTGFHPDMVTFTPDGSTVLVANEGEQDDPDDAPGGITRIDLSVSGDFSIGTGAVSRIVQTFDIALANLVPGASYDHLRHQPGFDPGEDTEPEYITVKGDKAYVSLQENNAVGVFDLSLNKWVDFQDLGLIQQVVDASDKDGILIDDTVAGLPMPDAIGSYQVAGKTYYVTANEGDARSEDVRFKDADIDPNTLAMLDAYYQSTISKDASDNDALGRLQISSWDGNLDADPEIERPTMYGTRSFSIWDAETGELVYDSGSAFELITAAQVPTYFNSEAGDTNEMDGRSDNKGPEPEGLVIGEAFGRIFAFIGLERTGGIMVYDITDPGNVQFQQYFNTLAANLADGVAPEGLDFFELDGAYYLAVSFEESGSVELYQFIPEPASFALMAIGVAAMLRRRRA